MVARVSSARLRIMLGHGNDHGSSLNQLLRGGYGQIEIANSALVRRVAEDIARTPYRGAAFNLYVQSKVIELLVNEVSISEEGDDQRIAYAVRDMLLADPVSPPSMAEISRMMGVPPRKLNAQFRAIFGMTAFEWLVDWRLIRARDLVMDGGVTIKDIAFSLGYSHVPTFSAAFTRRFGVAPSRFKAMRAQEQLS
ncbi:AraC-type DNA-binding domain-containing protein [Paramagnetospirillum magneticum AMB-1]|uniref:AraC-type DNA-binding domain-containing protein n=1 Tax=Paramagnetospirillum magneticum (strain ATCC 700264 / AMB-1) TaxID=342108 RepID=Q2W883_PARM1|nr:AraC-type DNA-binding domain-containing protein [Paramagnetospirillum magneticum AMB-1]